MRRICDTLAIVAVWLAVVAHPAHAAPVVVGVNATGVQFMNEQQQDSLIGQLLQAGVTRADLQAFSVWLVAQVEALEASGIRLSGFELGNEINGPFFNGDFLPSQASGRVLGISDLNSPNDPEGQAIAASYRSFLQIMAALKDVRDHSRLNQTTPIISAGLADGGLPGKKPGQKLGGVSIPATLEFLQQNGMDALVDGYGVHVYPAGDPHRPVSILVDILGQDAFLMCTSAKPCWLTEWGFNNGDKSCPVDDRVRVQLVLPSGSSDSAACEDTKFY